MAHGISTNKNRTKIAACLKKDYDLVIRYYCAGQSTKKLSRTEAEALCSAGLALAVVYENNPTNISYFSGNAGHRDGVDAYHYALQMHQTSGSAIYFGVDYDAKPEEISGAINDYFAGLAKGFTDAAQGQPPAYRIGVYGSGLCCQWLKAHNTAVKLTWLAESTAWSGSKAYKDWSIKQRFMLEAEATCGLRVFPKKPDNNDAEINDTQGDFGSFKVLV